MIAEALIVEIVRLCRDRLGIRFLQPRRGIVRTVSVDGTCVVDAWGGQIPKVKVMQPWPGCTLTFQKGADVLLEWPRVSGDTEDAAAPGELPVIVGFYSGTSVSVTILPGGAAAARVGDDVQMSVVTDPGFVLWAAAVQAACLTTPGSSAFQAAMAAANALGYTWPPVTVDSRITSGSGKVNIG